MSAQRDRHKEGEDRPSSHPFRTALIVSLVVAAIILWQLAPIIQGLHTLDLWLVRVQGPRRTLIGLLQLGYHRLLNVVTPLIHQVH